MAAAVGIIFDTRKWDRSVTAYQKGVINRFFDNLNLGQKVDTSVSHIGYGQLLDALDTDERFVYKGSVTTPPCARTVYWNVINKVYPVSQRHLNQYRAQLARSPTQNIQKTGNFRTAIQPTKAHHLRIVTQLWWKNPQQWRKLYYRRVDQGNNQGGNTQGGGNWNSNTNTNTGF